MPQPAHRLALLLVALAACSSSTPAPPSLLPDEGDARILQQVLNGTLAPADGLQQVAMSNGWPIKTSQGYLFALLDGGYGPYVLSSPKGAFNAVTMKSEAGVGWVLVSLPAPVGAEYRFATHFGDGFADPMARRFLYEPTEVGLVETHGPHLERWTAVGGVDPRIVPRTLRVWVPADPPTHFLYAHDGQNLFNPAGPWGGWRPELAAARTTLIVGIDNTSSRIDEYTQAPDLSPLQGGLAPAYADYVEQVVRPLIEARYGPPARTGLMGSSLGGLVTLYVNLRFPGRYDFVASLSGTVGWGSIQPGLQNPTVIERYRALTACPAGLLYLDSGGGPGTTGCLDSDGDGILDDGNGADNYCENAQLRDVLTGLGCTSSLHYAWEPGASHDEAAWKFRVARVGGVLDLFEAL
jgi:hypothetical protein